MCWPRHSPHQQNYAGVVYPGRSCIHTSVFVIVLCPCVLCARSSYRIRTVSCSHHALWFLSVSFVVLVLVGQHPLSVVHRAKLCCLGIFCNLQILSVHTLDLRLLLCVQCEDVFVDSHRLTQLFRKKVIEDWKATFSKRTPSFAKQEFKDEDGSERTLLGLSRGGHAAADQVSVCWLSEVFSTPVYVQGDTKKRELLKTPTKIEEIQEKNYWQKLNHYNLPFKRQ